MKNKPTGKLKVISTETEEVAGNVYVRVTFEDENGNLWAYDSKVYKPGLELLPRKS